MAEAEIRAVLDGYVDAWQRGDVAAVIACYHDDFRLTYFGNNALTGYHVGKAAALAVLAAFTRCTQRQLLGITAVMAGSTHGAVIAREKLGAGDAAIEVERVLVYTVAEGKLAECWVYDRDQAAIDRLIGAA